MRPTTMNPAGQDNHHTAAGVECTRVHCADGRETATGTRPHGECTRVHSADELSQVIGTSTDVIGTPIHRTDGHEQVCGATQFVDDIRPDGFWFGGTVRSPLPRGRIQALHRNPTFDWSRVVFVTAKDLPGPNLVAMIQTDYPILADQQVQFVTEPVALIAAPDRRILAEALAAVTVEIEPEPPVYGIEAALTAEPILAGRDNVLADFTVGADSDVEAGFAEADLFVEGTYRSGHQEQCYLEPQGVIAFPLAGGGIELIGSLQCPYYVHRALATGLGLAPEQVVVKQAATGGAFGGKEDYPSVLALHAAVLALASGQPVKMVYDRHEDLATTPKRHPSRVRHRTGVKKDGTLVATEIDVVLDAGAYASLSQVVLSRSILHAGGAYRWPFARVRGRAVATNLPPSGAFRGFGVPQSTFAVERHLDRIARELGLDPLELRRRNLVVDGDTLPCGQILKQPVGASLVLERVVKLSGYEEKHARYAADRQAADHLDEPPDLSRQAATRRGIGLALFYHGSGFTGAGEDKINGTARVRFQNGRLELLVSNVEMGQGAGTVLPMIAAQSLGLPLEMVVHLPPDTSIVPDSGPTVASRTTMIVGGLVAEACQDLARKLVEFLAREHGVNAADIKLEDGEFMADYDPTPRPLGSFTVSAENYLQQIGPLEGEGNYTPPPDRQWDEATHTGDAYQAYSWGAVAVEVEVDRATWEIRPLHATIVVEIGRAIHPVLAAGQVEGGVLQGLGYGYLEEIKQSNGRFRNDLLTTYLIPTTLDAPACEVELADLSSELPADQTAASSAFGAKGLGELPANGIAPALAAAI
ncbi:MAG: xanthine dehydrogenase family protein molybdopterin-binding subunit, partial [bacterium]